VDAPTLDWLDGVSDLKELAGGFFPIGKRSIISKLHAATLSSLSAPCMTILSISSGTGRCSDLGGAGAFCVSQSYDDYQDVGRQPVGYQSRRFFGHGLSLHKLTLGSNARRRM